MKGHQGEKGFTLIELLVVVAILGVISAVAVLAVTRFIGAGTVQSANTECHQASTAIVVCLSDAGAAQLTTYTNSSAYLWNGTAGIITATDGAGNIYDASNYLGTKKFKAAYNVTQAGSIVGANLTVSCASPWTGIYWNSTDSTWHNNGS